MLAIQHDLTSFVRTLDDRPVTCALAPHTDTTKSAAELTALTKKLAEDVDVLGLNYQEALYDAYTTAIDKPIVGT